MSTDGSNERLHRVEDDRRSLRVEILPTDEQTALQAAWLLGRLCNEMKFRFQSAWILFRDHEPIRTVTIWADLPVLVERTLIDVNAAWSVTETLRNTRTSWEQAFQSEWHSEELENANRTLRGYLMDGESLPNAVGEIDFVQFVSRYPADLWDEFSSRFMAASPEELRVTFQLGQIADQLIHPPFNPRAIHIDRDEPSLGTVASRATDANGDRASAHWNQSTLSISNWALRVPQQRSGVWPDAEWHRALHHAWARYCHLTLQEVTPLPTTWSPATTAAAILDRLEMDIHDTELEERRVVESDGEGPIVDALSSRGERVRRRLQLTVDMTGRTVSRMELESPVPLPPRLFRLFIYFLNQGDVQTTASWIGENWMLFSPRGNAISVDSVYAAIHQLDSSLEHLGLEARLVTTGYRLQEVRRES